MNDKISEYHPVLLRQLKRTGMNKDWILPDKQNEWENFLSRINHSYHDHEQECYLLERSMSISSREMMELNEKLTYAQRIAHLGYWMYNKKEEKLIWTEEMFSLTGMDPLNGPPTFDEIISFIHDNERKKIITLIEKVFSKKEMFEIEFQFKNKNQNQYCWFYMKCLPEINQKNIHKNQEVESIIAIVMDITERKKYEEKIKRSNERLIFLSRQAGMSEVATSVLHNIGNILNSTNVSINILKENFSKNYYIKLFKIINMLNENLNDLKNYLLDDPKGQLIPSYLTKLCHAIEEQYQVNLNEVNSINENLLHINDIVSMQNTISGLSSNVNEKVFIPDVIESSIDMVINTDKKSLIISREYEKTPYINIDKTKILQILVNLVQNAKDSVFMNEEINNKKIKFIVKNNDDFIKIHVIDNGIGIPKNNLERIFNFGFTTKEKGHGFGLHSSALAAKEMGGALNVDSIGIGKGATFILALPKNQTNDENEVANG